MEDAKVQLNVKESHNINISIRMQSTLYYKCRLMLFYEFEIGLFTILCVDVCMCACE